MRKDIINSFLGMLVFILLCGIAYPLLVTGISQVAFPGNANGQQVFVHGRLVGSKIIGQNFSDPTYKDGKEVMSDGNPVTTPDRHYFQTRPSGTDPADNDAGTEFANYGPNSVITKNVLVANIQAYITLNGRYYPGGLTAAKVPVDAADTSASGVDPDISFANADIQAYRIAAVDHLSLSRVHALMSEYSVGRGLGFSGEPGVDVLEVNVALYRLITGKG